MSKLMPVIFAGHGSPMNIVQDNEYTKTLTGQLSGNLTYTEKDGGF